MSETKWTPGPWSCMSESAHEGVYMDNCVHSVSKHAGDGDIICLSPSHEGYELSAAMWDANARLIAAAPDLHEALVHCEDLLMRYGFDRINGEEIEDEALTKIRAALAKARGERP